MMSRKFRISRNERRAQVTLQIVYLIMDRPPTRMSTDLITGE